MYDIIIIGAGSGGLSVGLFMNEAGFKVLMTDKSDLHIGGDCLNDGCVPSKALIHVAKIAHNARTASQFGFEVRGRADIRKAIGYVYTKQNIVRQHENANSLKKLGIDVALGEVQFTGRNEIEVNGKVYQGKKIVIATGSRPRKLNIPNTALVQYFDNESIFHINHLPEKLLVTGAGPMGIEIAQTMNRLGSKVTVIHRGQTILERDDPAVTRILLDQLQNEGIEFIFNSSITAFNSGTEAIIESKDGSLQTISFDAVFVAIGRKLNIENLQLNKAEIEVGEDKLILDQYLRTTNKNIFACGDVTGGFQFSHAAEFHARLLINNFFSPFRKKLNNDHLSWVTFTDPELASFGLHETQLVEKGIAFKRLERDFSSDDRAVVDNYQYAKLILYISKGTVFRKEKILGGTMVAPGAGELVQELILANSNGLSINTLFHKIYPYPVASRINQQIIVTHKQEGLTRSIKRLLRLAFKIFS